MPKKLQQEEALNLSNKVVVLNRSTASSPCYEVECNAIDRHADEIGYSRVAKKQSRVRPIHQAAVQSLYHKRFTPIWRTLYFPADKHDVPRWLNEGIGPGF